MTDKQVVENWRSQLSPQWQEITKNAFENNGDGPTPQTLTLNIPDEITSLEPLASLTCLEKLTISGAIGITSLEPLARLTRLKTLDCSDCPGLTSLEPLASLINLEWLDCRGCTKIEEFNFCDSGKLKTLDLERCSGLTSLKPLASLASLMQLSISGCNGLTSLEPLANLTRLELLDCSHCPGITSLEPLAKMESLVTLYCSDCPGISSLDPLRGLFRLEQLYCSGCPSIVTTDPLLGLSKLTIFSCDSILKSKLNDALARRDILHNKCTPIDRTRAYVLLSSLDRFNVKAIRMVCYASIYHDKENNDFFVYFLGYGYMGGGAQCEFSIKSNLDGTKVLSSHYYSADPEYHENYMEKEWPEISFSKPDRDAFSQLEASEHVPGYCLQETASMDDGTWFNTISENMLNLLRKSGCGDDARYEYCTDNYIRTMCQIISCYWGLDTSWDHSDIFEQGKGLEFFDQLCQSLVGDD